jgi:plasmid maintenance system antidote protein VapI
MAATHPGMLLDKEIQRRGITRKEACQVLGVSHATLHFWIKGKWRPRAVKQALIEAWSEGRIPREVWLDPEERTALSRVRRAGRAA